MRECVPCVALAEIEEGGISRSSSRRDAQRTSRLRKGDIIGEGKQIGEEEEGLVNDIDNEDGEREFESTRRGSPSLILFFTPSNKPPAAS